MSLGTYARHLFYKLLPTQIQPRLVFRFLRAWRIYILMQDQRLLSYTYACFLQKDYEASKANPTGAAH